MRVVGDTATVPGTALVHAPTCPPEPSFSTVKATRQGDAWYLVPYLLAEQRVGTARARKDPSSFGKGSRRRPSATSAPTTPPALRQPTVVAISITAG